MSEQYTADNLGPQRHEGSHMPTVARTVAALAILGVGIFGVHEGRAWLQHELHADHGTHAPLHPGGEDQSIQQP